MAAVLGGTNHLVNPINGKNGQKIPKRFFEKTAKIAGSAHFCHFRTF